MSECHKISAQINVSFSWKHYLLTACCVYFPIVTELCTNAFYDIMLFYMTVQMTRRVSS